MATVVVGCKLPNGLIMSLGDKTVNLNGANSALVIGGHGITNDVDKSLFDAWLALHADKDFVKNDLVFAHEARKNAEAQAKDQATLESGLEPLLPKDMPKGMEVVPSLG